MVYLRGFIFFVDRTRLRKNTALTAILWIGDLLLKQYCQISIVKNTTAASTKGGMLSCQYRDMKFAVAPTLLRNTSLAKMKLALEIRVSSVQLYFIFVK